MTYRDYAWLIKPDNVGSDYGGGVVGCPQDYGLEDVAECESRTDFSKHTDCWSQEIQGRVIAEALEDGSFGFDFEKGERFIVTEVSIESKTIRAKRNEEFAGYYIDPVKNKFKFYIEKEESNMKYKVGDKVRVRSWESMEKEFGLKDDGNIKVMFTFTKGMKKYCGKLVTISSNNGSYMIEEDSGMHTWCDDMFWPAEFTKKDLRNWMIVEYKNGDRRIYIEGNISGLDGHCSITSHRDDLTYIDHDLDIDRVYEFSSGTLRYALECPGTLIWERGKTVKEISLDEAFRILEEKLGCPVKIKKD